MLVGPNQRGFRAMDYWASPCGCEAQILNLAEPQVLDWAADFPCLVDWVESSAQLTRCLVEERKSSSVVQN